MQRLAPISGGHMHLRAHDFGKALVSVAQPNLKRPAHSLNESNNLLKGY